MSQSPSTAVFLSYASQDAEAAKRIANALRGAGVEVWFDAEGGLEHGDEWDRKIRRQIKDCVLFIAIISANTQAREEGYFRIEWELAAQRVLGIASGVAFILPIVIDDTKEFAALVPDRFRSVQWTRLPGGNVPPDVLQRFLKLWSHRTGALKQAATGEVEAGRPRPAERGEGALSPNKLRYAFAAVVLLILGAVLYVALKPRRSPE
ncbi:MAG: cellulose synthase subunit BcsC, partial [Lacunisphaera sp.]|nr:cellulose synthase subunit BcsC [Lacunisphaera sp.]